LGRVDGGVDGISFGEAECTGADTVYGTEKVKEEVLIPLV
jgi:hypothetical protein